MNPITNEFEKGDIEISLFDLETELTEDGLELTFWFNNWFDADKKFGTHINGDDNAWVNMYARYIPETDSFTMFWYVDEEWKPIEEKEYTPTETEKKLIIDLLDKSLFEVYGMHLPAFCEKEKHEWEWIYLEGRINYEP